MLVNLFIFLTGSIIGSFLNVCIARLPKEESVVFPSSHCPKCNKNIRPIDNIPIISYLFLLGKCRFCQKTISFRYPLVELLSGVGFIFLYISTSSLPEFIFWSLIYFLFIIAFFTDLEEQIIPDEVIIIGLISGLIFMYFRGAIVDSILGAAYGVTMFFLIAKIAKFIAKKDALGFGDVKLGAMIGAIFGVAGFWNTFMWSYLIGAAISILLLVTKIKKTGDYIPFGPFLILGAIITYFGGPQLLLAIFR